MKRHIEISENPYFNYAEIIIKNFKPKPEMLRFFIMFKFIMYEIITNSSKSCRMLSGFGSVRPSIDCLD